MTVNSDPNPVSKQTTEIVANPKIIVDYSIAVNSKSNNSDS